ncbi:MAG: AAA family ATPase [Candidatus Omnitrophota bacterium]
MKKRFNTTGACTPEKHYMVDISNKIDQIMDMIDNGDYFVIDRPRQYGKTTTINVLNRRLKKSEDYFSIKISFEGIGEEGFKSVGIFIEEFFLQLKKAFKSSGNEDLINFIETNPIPDRFSKLDLWVGDLVRKNGKKIVLMIDEIDKSTNNQLFLDFLGMLRNKYLMRDDEGQPTFHSVILVGVHDVKNLKLKLRPEAETKYNSPWNIAVDFNVDLSFSPIEIESMLGDYVKEQNVAMDVPLIAKRLFYFTSGYPFLVSHLCKIIDEKMLGNRIPKEWKPEDIDKAVQISVKQKNTNSENLIKNLENNPDLYDFIFKMIIGGVEFSYNPDQPVIEFGSLHGIIKEENGKVKVHNRIYEQRIYNYMASGMEITGGIHDFTGKYIDEKGILDIEKILCKFQEFMKEQYNKKDNDFIERNGRLLFLAFIKPIINGRGFDFKEVQISEEKRLDVVITFDNRKTIIELKIWRGETYHQEGIRQLGDYLDRQNQSNGYLLIFDLRKESGRIGKMETIETQGKTILAAWT